jgi:hypothetical protein
MGERCCTVQGCTQMALGMATSCLGIGLVRGEVCVYVLAQPGIHPIPGIDAVPLPIFWPALRISSVSKNCDAMTELRRAKCTHIRFCMGLHHVTRKHARQVKALTLHCVQIVDPSLHRVERRPSGKVNASNYSALMLLLPPGESSC